MKHFDRRDFLKTASLSAASLATASLLPDVESAFSERPLTARYMGGFAAPKLETVRIAVIGVGNRGPDHLQFSASLPGTEIVAISDLYEDLATKWAGVAKDIGAGERHQNIAIYYGSENGWRQMLRDVRPDIVFIATNWLNHAPMAIEVMNNGAHAFVEVPLATTLEDLWEIVDTSERTQRHCMMMENVCYGRDELMFLNMCRQDVIGDLLHGEGAYLHDLRWQMENVERGTGSWRTLHYANRNGNLYPTHGLGPVAQYMNVARTQDMFSSLVSYSSPSIGRKAYAAAHYPPDHKWNQLEYKCGDMNTSLVRTQSGRTIMVQWSETDPRPYSRLNLIQGTKGILAGFPTRIALEGGVEGVTEDQHAWAEGENLEILYEKFDHPLYRRLNETAEGSGHGGMDGVMMYRIIECLRNGLLLDQNMYEGCLWSAVGPLSERSVASGGAPQPFPDFTRGDWKTTEPLGIVE